ncbi:hypothetical protein [Bdellovibrio sp. HCB288]|uniref:hypothetical protein n=1 Tax=Bdellovibrio sp. HCB288 TaxID=3394355 RepID=UPI0039B561D0
MKLSLKKLIDDLDYWIFIGTGDDIVNAPSNRQEYQHLVSLARERGIESSKIPKFTLKVLQKEARHPSLCSPTKRILFWRRFKGVILRG